MRTLAAGAMVVMTVAAGALAQEASLREPAVDLGAGKQPEAAGAPGGGKPVPERFGAAGSEWITLGGGLAYDFSDATDVALTGAYSNFLVEDFEFALELRAWYFNQRGPDAAGINPAMTLRWHFINEGPWTVYGDLGIGVLYASDEVPDEGTQFNFTPTAGFGFTRQLTDSGMRLQMGVRWHHISNARITGDVNNPSRDAPLLYAGVQFPF